MLLELYVVYTMVLIVECLINTSSIIQQYGLNGMRQGSHATYRLKAGWDRKRK